MFRTIGVLLDGSRFAECALPWAARLARRAHGSLRLLMVHQPAMAGVAAREVGSPQEDETLRSEAGRYLADTATRWEAICNCRVDVVLEEGLAGPTLIELADSNPPDLLVLTSHSRGGMGRLWVGSVADYVIRHATIPTLLIRPGAAVDLPVAVPEIRRILVPLDLSKESEAILGAAGSLAWLAQAHVTLLHVLERDAPVAVPRNGTAREVLRALDRIADWLRELGHNVAARVISAPNAAGGIQAELASGRYDLVAMSTQGGGGTRPPGLGHVAEAMIRGPEIPLLLVGAPRD